MSYESIIARQSELTRAAFGFDGTTVEQGSPEWLGMRLGVMTASRASEIIATGGAAPLPDDVEFVKVGRSNVVNFNGTEYTGSKVDITKAIRATLPPVPSETRRSYLCELVGQIITLQQPDQIDSRATQWGHDNEDKARQIFAFHTGMPVRPVTFIYGDESMRAGCSPDGIADEQSGIEIKCPFTTKVYVDFVVNGKIKPEYVDQVQFSMFITGLPYWHFANYDPRAIARSFESIVIERDEAKMKTFADAVGQMSSDIDSALEKFGVAFGSQWEPIRKQHAA